MALALVAVPLPNGAGSDYFFVPIATTIVVVVLALALRWMMRPGSRPGARVADPSQGLLIGVMATDPAEAERIRGLLLSAGIRATTKPVAARQQILVWPADVDRALRLIAADRADRR